MSGKGASVGAVLACTAAGMLGSGLLGVCGAAVALIVPTGVGAWGRAGSTVSAVCTRLGKAGNGLAISGLAAASLSRETGLGAAASSGIALVTLVAEGRLLGRAFRVEASGGAMARVLGLRLGAATATSALEGRAGSFCKALGDTALTWPRSCGCGVGGRVGGAALLTLRLAAPSFSLGRGWSWPPGAVSAIRLSVSSSRFGLVWPMRAAPGAASVAGASVRTLPPMRGVLSAAASAR